MNELLPCPFCGGEAILESNKLRYGTIYSAYCQKCGAEITGFSEHEAIDAWNRRAEDERYKNALKEIIKLACESVEREKTLARLEAEVMTRLEERHETDRC